MSIIPLGRKWKAFSARRLNDSLNIKVGQNYIQVENEYDLTEENLTNKKSTPSKKNAPLGFDAERARLVVQVIKLRYAARRLFRALRFARGLKKSASYLCGF